VVAVRPDQYVAHVLALHHHEALDAFLAGVMREAVAGRPRGGHGSASATLAQAARRSTRSGR
jgi:hypothetical protein